MDIDLPKLLTRVRAGEISDQPSVNSHQSGLGLSAPFKFGLQMYSRFARSPRLFAVSQKLAALGTRLVSPFSPWMRLPAVTGWGYSKDFPRFAAKPFRDKFVESEVSRLRKSQEEPTSEDVGVQASHLHSQETPTSPDVGVRDRIKQFTEELAAVGGHVTLTDNPTQSVIEFLNMRQINKIHLEPNVLNESALCDAGITVTHDPDPALLVGVTKAVCGLADTGSVLILDGAGSPLQASLLPEIHIAILRASDILPSLENAVHLIRPTNAAVVITGPSRTGDIEMTLTIGMHGPGELHVFLVA